MRVDGIEDGFGELVRFQQTAELEQCRGIRCRFPRQVDPDNGLEFDFRENTGDGEAVMTGHDNGRITLNVAEADDDERTRRRMALHEPYRTLIGHLRHESGHFYWDQLIAHSAWLEPFRALFGYEGHDYSQALKQHYDKNPFDTQWRENFISAYATSHAWEDWAETWAHYLHMVDLMETAASYHTCITVPDIPNRGPQSICNPLGTEPVDFELMQSQWVPLTLLHNSLNRSLGHEDAYPFAISAAAWNKLRFVHDLIQANRQRSATAPADR